MRTFVSLAAVFVLAMIAGPAVAESGVMTLQGGQESVVASMPLNAGDVVEWSYSSAGFTTFTIDREGAGVAFSTSALFGAGKFTAAANGQYVFSFSNTGDSPALVTYDVKRPFNWLPIIAAAGITVAAGVIAALLWSRKKRPTVQAPVGTPADFPPPPPPP